MEKRVYTPHSNIRKPWLMLAEMLSDIKKGQDLALRLTIRDIKALYRQSFLGLLWAFIIPLGNTVTWIFLNGTGIVSMGDTGIPYPIYVFTGTMIWSVFSESLLAPIKKITANKTTIAKVNFPREAIIMSAIYESIFNALIKILILVAAVAFMGYSGSWTLLLLPVAILSIVLAGTSLGLVLAPIGTLYTDISKGLPLILQFLMYTTPVVYAIPDEGLTAKIINNNPLTPLICTARDWLTGQPTAFLDGFFWVNLGTLILFLLTMVAFRLAVPILVERMNA